MWLLTTFLGGFQVVFWFNRRVAAIWMFLSRWWLMFSRDALETPDPMPSQFVILAASLLNVLKLNAFCISFGWWCVVLSSSCSTMCLVFKFRKNIIYIYVYKGTQKQIMQLLVLIIRTKYVIECIILRGTHTQGCWVTSRLMADCKF